MSHSIYILAAFQYNRISVPNKENPIEIWTFAPKFCRILDMGKDKTESTKRALANLCQDRNINIDNINDHLPYDIDYLVTTWEHGWEELAELGNKLGIQPYYSSFGYSGACISKQILEGFQSITYMSRESAWPYGLEPTNLLELAAIPKRKTYSEKVCRKYIPKAKDDGGSAEEDARLRRLLKKVMTILRDSKTLGEAFDKIGTRQNREKLFREYFDDLKYISGDIISGSEKVVRDGLQFKLEKSCYNVLVWLIEGLKNERAREEAYWNCVRLAAEPMINEMQEIKRRIRMDIPLANEQHEFLDYYVSLGCPHVYRIGGNDDPETYRVILDIGVDNQTYTDFHNTTSMMLINPAFILAQELEKKSSKPRFIRQCRAPSCGKLFYTGRKDATACPGSQGDKKNMCALEWIRYKRYLVKIRKDPDKNWDNQKLQREFTSYDKD